MSTTTLTPATSSVADIEVLCDTRTPRERVLGSLVYKNFNDQVDCALAHEATSRFGATVRNCLPYL